MLSRVLYGLMALPPFPLQGEPRFKFSSTATSSINQFKKKNSHVFKKTKQDKKQEEEIGVVQSECGFIVPK